MGKKLYHKNTARKNQNGKSLIKRQSQKPKHFKRMDNICHISDLVQAFSYIENGELNLVLQLAKPLTCMYDSRIIPRQLSLINKI